jgi:hypothetical protein
MLVSCGTEAWPDGSEEKFSGINLTVYNDQATVGRPESRSSITSRSIVFSFCRGGRIVSRPAVNGRPLPCTQRPERQGP